MLEDIYAMCFAQSYPSHIPWASMLFPPFTGLWEIDTEIMENIHWKW